MINKLIEKIKNNWFDFSLWAICILGVWIRLHVYLFNRSLWMDEAALANNLMQTRTILNNMSYNQAAPPLFKLITLEIIKPFQTEMGYVEEYWLRLLPLICGVLSIFVFLLIIRKLFYSKVAQIISLILFSSNYMLIYYSSEFKQYSSDVLCVLILIYLALKVDLKTCSKKMFLILSLFYAGVFWLSHASLFVLAALLPVNFLELKNDLSKLVKLYLPAAVSFIVFYFLHLRTVSNSDFMHEFWANYFINSYENLKHSLCSVVNSLFYQILNPWLILSIILLGMVVLIIKNRQKIALILTLPTFLLLLLSYFEVYPFACRLVLFVFPLMIIYYCYLLEVAGRKKIFLSIIILALYVVTLIPYFLKYSYVITKRNIWLREEIRTLYEYIETRIEPDDIIFMANDMCLQNKWYIKKFKFKNEIIETTNKYEIPFELMQSGKKYMIIFDHYWRKDRQKNLIKIVNWINQNAIILRQYAYYENYVFYVEKR